MWYSTGRVTRSGPGAHGLPWVVGANHDVSAVYLHRADVLGQLDLRRALT